MGNLEEGLSTGDFERRVKGDLGTERLSLKRLRGGVIGGGSSFTRDPGRYVKKGSGYGHLSPWGPFQAEGTWNQEGGSYTGDFEG